jgi:hypothetical protein
MYPLTTEEISILARRYQREERMNLQMARALKQLRQASSNLADVANGTGNELARRGANVADRLANALQFGKVYHLQPITEEFDKVLEAQEK